MKIVKSITTAKSTIFKPIKKYKNKLCINTQYANLIIEKSDIIYLQSESNYCRIHLLDGSNIFCSKTMKEINLRIDNSQFIKVHKSFTINLDEIISIEPSYRELTLRNGTKIPIARAKKNEIKEVLKFYFD